MVRFVAAALLVVVIAFVALVSSPAPTVEAQLRDTAAAMNNACPQQLGKGLVLQRVDSAGNTITAHHTMTDLSRDDFDEVSLAELHGLLRDHAEKDAGFTELRERGVRLLLTYSDFNGQHVLNVELEPLTGE